MPDLFKQNQQLTEALWGKKFSYEAAVKLGRKYIQEGGTLEDRPSMLDQKKPKEEKDGSFFFDCFLGVTNNPDIRKVLFAMMDETIKQAKNRIEESKNYDKSPERDLGGFRNANEIGYISTFLKYLEETNRLKDIDTNPSLLTRCDELQAKMPGLTGSESEPKREREDVRKSLQEIVNQSAAVNKENFTKKKPGEIDSYLNNLAYATSLFRPSSDEAMQKIRIQDPQSKAEQDLYYKSVVYLANLVEQKLIPRESFSAMKEKPVTAHLFNEASQLLSPKLREAYGMRGEQPKASAPLEEAKKQCAQLRHLSSLKNALDGLDNTQPKKNIFKADFRQALPGAIDSISKIDASEINHPHMQAIIAVTIRMIEKHKKDFSPQEKQDMEGYLSTLKGKQDHTYDDRKWSVGGIVSNYTQPLLNEGKKQYKEAVKQISNYNKSIKRINDPASTLTNEKKLGDINEMLEVLDRGLAARLKHGNSLTMHASRDLLLSSKVKELKDLRATLVSSLTALETAKTVSHSLSPGLPVKQELPVQVKPQHEQLLQAPREAIKSFEKEIPKVLSDWMMEKNTNKADTSFTLKKGDAVIHASMDKVSTSKKGLNLDQAIATLTCFQKMHPHGAPQMSGSLDKETKKLFSEAYEKVYEKPAPAALFVSKVAIKASMEKDLSSESSNKMKL